MATTAQVHKRTKKHPSQSITVRNDILKLLYAGMLLEMPLSLVREFWARHPLPDLPQKNDENKLFTTIWQEKQRTNIEYLVSVLNDVEPFFTSHEIDTIKFVKKTFQRINKGMLISAKSILRWGKPFLSYFYHNKDPRPLILQILDYFSEQLASGIVHKLVKHVSDGQWHTATILLMYSHAIEPLRLKRQLFYRDFPAYDCELWTAMLVQSTPYCLKMPPFEELSMVSDCRTVQQIVPDADITGSNSTVLINGEPYGTTTTFRSFCTERHLDLQKFKIPSRQAVCITRDYFCPVRKRVVLHANCIYGAPVYLYAFRYKSGVEKPEDFMATIIDEATGDTNDGWTLVQEIHEAMLEKVSFKADIIYFNEEESISVNGKHLIKYVPAKILRKMLTAYLETGQTVFENREFVRDENIIHDPLNPNLNIRLQRLSKALDEDFHRISISREDRGKIRLNVDCKVSFTEQ